MCRSPAVYEDRPNSGKKTAAQPSSFACRHSDRVCSRLKVKSVTRTGGTATAMRTNPSISAPFDLVAPTMSAPQENANGRPDLPWNVDRFRRWRWCGSAGSTWM